MITVLFKKTLAALQAAFVTARFLEKGRFEDLPQGPGEWFGGEALASRPDLNRWLKYIGRTSPDFYIPEWREATEALGRDRWLYILSKYCVPVTAAYDPGSGQSAPHAGTNLAMHAVLRCFAAAGAVIYLGSEDQHLLIWEGKCFAVSEDGIRDVVASDILGALLAAWVRLEDGGPDSARAYLIRWIGAVAAKMREAAHAAFEQAPIVSTSGKHIVCPKFVFVYSADASEGWLYPAELFVGNKIRRPGEWWVDHKAASDIPFRSFLAQCGVSVPDAPSLNRVLHFVREKYPCYISCAEGSVFCLRAANCPSPLPKGGELLHIGVR